MSKDDINAVTWGVFWGREIIQPTVVDHTSFMIWKDEAFQSWVDIWAVIYGNDNESYKFLEKVQRTFFLMNIVDNDFINGDLNKVILDFVDENKQLIDSL